MLTHVFLCKNSCVFSLSGFVLGNEKMSVQVMSREKDLGSRFKSKYKPVCVQTFFSVLGNSVIKGS